MSKIGKQVVHHTMALPDAIRPQPIFYSKDQFFRNENKEFLRIFYFSKLNIQN
jgi:hypothetical protein